MFNKSSIALAVVIAVVSGVVFPLGHYIGERIVAYIRRCLE